MKEPAVATRENFDKNAYTDDGLERAEAGGRRADPRADQGRARTVCPRDRCQAREAVHAGGGRGYDPRHEAQGPHRERGVLRRPVQGQGDQGPFAADQAGGRRRRSATTALRRRPGQPDRDRHPRQHAQGRLGRDEPLHDRAAAGRQLQHAGRADPSAAACACPTASGPACRRGSADHRLARPVPGDRR